MMGWFSAQDRRRGLGGFALGMALASVLSGCSPSMFFGNDVDKGVRNTKRYRAINFACSGLDLSSSELTRQDVVNIVNCFNSNGGLQPIAELVARLNKDPATFQPLVDWSNIQFMRNRKLMYELEKTYFALDKRKLLRDTFKQFGRLLANEEFVASGIALLRESVFEDGSAIPDIESKQPDPRLLKGLRRLSIKANPQSIVDAIDAGLILTGARAFPALQKRFTGDSPSGRKLRDVTDAIHAYGLEMTRPERFDPIRGLLSTVKDGSLFKGFDRFFLSGGEGSVTENDLIARVPLVAATFKALHTGNPAPAAGVISLFHALNRPITCLKGSQRVENGLRWAVTEIADHHKPSEASDLVLREDPINLALFGPFCDLPPGLTEEYAPGKTNYDALREMAATTAMEPMAELLRDFHHTTVAQPDGSVSRPMLDYLVGLISDTDDANKKGLIRLLPLTGELTDRGAWEEAFLLAALPVDEDRAKLQDAVAFALEPSGDLDGESLYDVAVRTISRTSALNLYRFVKSLSRFVDEESPIGLPALKAMRTAVFVNEAHPFMDLLHNILESAPEKGEFYRSMFKVADMPEFAASVKLVSEMARDERLSRLLGSVITLFHKYAAQGNYGKIATLAEVPFQNKHRHDLTREDLTPFELKPLATPDYGPCAGIDFTFDLSHYEDSAAHGAQMDKMLACLDSKGGQTDSVRAVTYFREALTRTGRPFLEFTIDSVRTLGDTLNAGEVGDLVDRWKRSYGEHKFQRVLDVIPYWVSKSVSGGPADAGGPVLAPLLDALEPVADREKELQRLQNTGADAVLNPGFPKLVDLAERVYDSAKGPDAKPAQAEEEARFPRDEIKSWLRARECHSNPTPGKNNPGWEDRRTHEIIDDYLNGVTSWDLVNRKARRNWTRDEFEQCLGGPREGLKGPSWCANSLFEKVSNKEHWDGDNSVIRASLSLVRYFTLPPGQQPDLQRHYPPEYLGQWFRQKADDYRLVSYIYPGERYPRLRLVNTLDRLELVLINADMDLDVIPEFVRDSLATLMGLPSVPENAGKHFLALVGEAWGDEPEALWPLPIRNKYAGRRPPTLREAYGEIHKTAVRLAHLLGFPDLPPCPNAGWQFTNSHMPDWLIKPLAKGLDPFELRRVLFNLTQVEGVIAEMLPDATGPQRGSLKVLRDMFYEFYYSTPPKYRHSAAKWRNNLSVILQLVRFGLGRQTGRMMRHEPASDPALKQFFVTLAKSGTSAHTRPLLDALFQRDFEEAPGKAFRDRAVWKVLNELLDLAADPAQEPLSKKRKAELERRRCTGNLQSTLRDEWLCEVGHMKQLAYYLFAQMSQPAPSGGHALGGQAGLVDPLVQTLREVVSKHKHYLSKNPDRIRSLLRWKDPARWTRALYDDRTWDQKRVLGEVLKPILAEPANAVDAVTLLSSIDADPRTKAALDTFSDRWEALDGDPEYEAVELEPLVRDVVKFFKEDCVADCASLTPFSPGWKDVNTACKLRKYLAERLRAGDGTEWLHLIATGAVMPSDAGYCKPGSKPGCGPEQFTKLLQALGAHAENGDLQSFFDLVHRSLSK